MTGCIHWSTKICALSHAPQATEHVCFIRVVRHEDATLKCIPWLIVMKCSAIEFYQFHNSDIRCQLFYLNYIPITAYSMTYLTTDRNMHRNYMFWCCLTHI